LLVSTSFGKMLSGREKSRVGVKVYSRVIFYDIDNDNNDVDVDDAE